MQSTIYTCDVCSKQKREVNHWFLYLEGEGAAIEFEFWSDGELAKTWGHLCGLECAGKKLNEVLAKTQQPQPEVSVG